MDLSWEWRSEGAHDARAVVDDWSKLDEFLDKMPDPAADPAWDELERGPRRRTATDATSCGGSGTSSSSGRG